MSKTRDQAAVAKGGARPNLAAELPRQASALKTETLQNAILNSANFAIIATDANGIIQLFNIGAERMLGYAAGEVVNRLTPSDIHDSQEVVARAEALSAEFAVTITPGFGALAFKASRGIEDKYDLTYIRKDGSRFPAQVSITALRDEQTEIIGYLLIGTDNAAQVAMIAADKEKAAQVAAIAADREKVAEEIFHRRRMDLLKDEFVSTVSHELRTPLTSIAGALGLLAGNAAGKLPDPAAHLLSIAYSNAQRLIRLLDDILDIEKIESGTVVFDMQRIDVCALIERAIEANRAFAEGYDVRLRLDPACEPADVRADPDRLMQVFTNLFSNAVKFSPSGQDVVVAVETRGNTVRISVRDHGHGVPDAFKPRIFEKFAQADATDARQKGGTGLGLSIVKEIVARFDGTVGFEDAPGGGAIFHVELPTWAQALKAQSHLFRRSDLRVLLCEDNHEAAIVLVDRLCEAGFVTDVAFTANEAIARLAAASYAAILVDLQLPEGDGIGLIKQLRAQPGIYNTLLVVLSADPEQAGPEERPSTLLNILDWLDTPIDVAGLVRVLDRPIVRNGNTRPRILHVDADCDMLRVVANALGATAEVMSVDSIDKARRALAANAFDVAVLDVALAAGSGFELLHELRDSEGDAIPLVVFSPQDANPVFAVQVRAALLKSRTSIDNVIATLRKRLGGDSPPPNDKEAA